MRQFDASNSIQRNWFLRRCPNDGHDQTNDQALERELLEIADYPLGREKRITNCVKQTIYLLMGVERNIGYFI